MRFARSVLLAILSAGPQLRAHAADGYPLDPVPRVMADGDGLPCERGRIPLVRYRGERVRFQKPLSVHPAFVPHLQAFEQLVVEVATAHYGRAPRRIVHLGGYACRKMRRYPTWVSEHALGNAVDVAGFDFAPVPKRSAAGVQPALRKAFEVRLDRDFRAEGARAVHAAFLHDLARRIAQDAALFSVLLGPGYPGHDNHFHLDMAPYRLVDYRE